MIAGYMQQKAVCYMKMQYRSYMARGGSIT